VNKDMREVSVGYNGTGRLNAVWGFDVSGTVWVYE
jgi:hypothetical protein